MPAKSNRDLVQELYDAICKGDMETVDRLGGDAPMENVGFHQVLTLREDSETIHDAFPEMSIEVLEAVDSGNLIFVEGKFRGTHTGTLRTQDGDLEPTGRDVELRFVDIYECSDGRIKAGRTYLDRMTIFSQLGVGEEPARGEAPGAHP